MAERSTAGWIIGAVVAVGCLGACGLGGVVVLVSGVAGFSAMAPPDGEYDEAVPEWLEEPTLPVCRTGLPDYGEVEIGLYAPRFRALLA